MKVLLLLALAAATPACRSTPDAPAAERRLELADERPASSYVALVRTLETIDAIRPVDSEVRLRAIECTTMSDHAHGGEIVRVLLDLTVLARDFATADRTFSSLESALETEGSATRRTPTVGWDRARRLFDTMQWNAPRVVDEDVFEGLVSVSRSLRVEVRASASPEMDVEPHAAEAVASEEAGEYIRGVAARDDVAIGPVVTRSSLVRPRAGVADVRYSIRPVDREAEMSREQIGCFLYQLEDGSPNVRVTRIKIEPAAPGSDVTDDAWTFEADISLRLRET